MAGDLLLSLWGFFCPSLWAFFFCPSLWGYLLSQVALVNSVRKAPQCGDTVGIFFCAVGISPQCQNIPTMYLITHEKSHNVAFVSTGAQMSGRADGHPHGRMDICTGGHQSGRTNENYIVGLQFFVSYQLTYGACIGRLQTTTLWVFHGRWYQATLWIITATLWRVSGREYKATLWMFLDASTKLHCGSFWT